ncbi:hypothetical protein [Streptomyces sp. NPDC057702]|uniref:hypothetical protein n=1 Tax=unclassified Streptomyces TaxID=2593676 RepID=UPI00368442EA
MRTLRTLLATTGTVAALVLSSTVMASAAERPSGAANEVTHVALGNGVTLLLDVDSPEELAPSCPRGQFCGYSDQAGHGLAWECGFTPLPSNWNGSGWWYNNLTGSRTRVRMNTTGSPYTTPRAPYQDATADWTPVVSLNVCVA